MSSLLDASDGFGYHTRLYGRVEDLAEAADWAARGPAQDAAIDRYLQALHAVCRLRSETASERRAGAKILEIVAGERVDGYPKKAA
ncbi:hypothetical protein [Nocardia rhizosphaerae]|uniref:Uncharacterized protein n=1 Tax=Nocardia rhizosphaerae TaxID=1691571 RepID=A0ABV8LF74_9NOCA